jgi:hypothetical protein
MLLIYQLLIRQDKNRAQEVKDVGLPTAILIFFSHKASKAQRVMKSNKRFVSLCEVF